jgi:hypothetical protein
MDGRCGKACMLAPLIFSDLLKREQGVSPGRNSPTSTLDSQKT